MPEKKSTHNLRLVRVLVGFCAVFIGVLWWYSREPATLRVWFVDVGQGDAIVLRTPSRQTIVVDGGPSADFHQQLDRLLPVTDRGVDLLVATHEDSDHIGGLADVLTTRRVHQVLQPKPEKQSSVAERFRAAVAAAGAEVITPNVGQAWVFGDVRITVLWPQVDRTETGNEASIVLHVQHGADDFLLTGDLGESSERVLVQQGQVPDVEVLKVGHHGSKHSTSQVFLDAAEPEIAILSAGRKNRYGHPAQMIVDRLRAAGMQIFRTDQQGTILCTSGIQPLTCAGQ